jgi:hypothetical protein
MHRSLRLAAATREKRGVNERNSARRGLVSQEKYLLLVGVGLRQELPVVPVTILCRAKNPLAVNFLDALLALGGWIFAFWGIFQLALELRDFLFDLLNGLLLCGDLRLLIL